MSCKLSFIPEIKDYDYIRQEMNKDLEYRLENRTDKTMYGRPLYKNINVQIITTHECQFNCPFCMERQNPMEGWQNFAAQAASLYNVLMIHPDARITVTGGEPLLYSHHVNTLYNIYKNYSNRNAFYVNTTGFGNTVYGQSLNRDIPLNISVNNHLPPLDLKYFRNRITVQTVMDDEKMHLDYLRKWALAHNNRLAAFSFRFLSGLDKHDYSVDIWNELRQDLYIKCVTFRIGDFFVYCNYYDEALATFCRVTLGDMWQQQHNDYKDGAYSNLIIHPDGSIGQNWK